MKQWKITGGKIWSNGKLADNNEITIEVNDAEDRVIYLDSDDVVLPGLVDFHCHPWAPGAVAESNIADSLLASSGIVACVDGGTFGYDGWERADRFWKGIDTVDIQSLLNVRPEGFTKIPNPVPSKAQDISIASIVDTYKKAGGRILGMKVTLGTASNAYDDEKILELARESADKCGCFVAMHLTKSHLSLETIEPYLKAGDLLLHPFHGEQGNALNEAGEYSDTMFKMKQKGIMMDVAVGRSHLSWKVAQAAFAKGFHPDVITSDQVLPSWQKATLRDLPNIMSAFTAGMGMTMEEVLDATIGRPLKYMGIKMDISKNLLILRKKVGDVKFPDTYGNYIDGEFEYVASVVIRNNKILVADEE